MLPPVGDTEGKTKAWVAWKELIAGQDGEGWVERKKKRSIGRTEGMKRNGMA